MIQTYKVKHNRDFERELGLARKVAEYSIINKNEYSLIDRYISSKDVKHIGLKSMIANQILRKYSRNKKLRRIFSVKLIVPNQGIKVKDNKIYIPCLKLWLEIWFDRNFEKINQIEIGKEFAYISVSYKETKLYEPISYFGVDRNTTGHVLVASNPTTGKVLKMGKECNHIHNKYKEIRRQLQKKGKLRLLKKIKHRESNIIKNINHQISRKLVNVCKEAKAGIVLENLKDIRRTAKIRKKQRYSHNSWSFYQLENMIEYKAKKLGIPIFYIEPQYTSQRCSRCGHIENANRQEKMFHCKKCGTVENADVNAGFNIALCKQLGISQFNTDRDALKGSTDTPKEASSPETEITLEPRTL